MCSVASLLALTPVWPRASGGADCALACAGSLNRFAGAACCLLAEASLRGGSCKGDGCCCFSGVGELSGCNAASGSSDSICACVIAEAPFRDCTALIRSSGMQKQSSTLQAALTESSVALAGVVL